MLNIIQERASERSGLFKQLLDQKQEDSTDLFCRSIAMSLKSLRPDLRNEGKLRMLELISELEHRNTPPVQPVPYYSSSSTSISTCSTPVLSSIVDISASTNTCTPILPANNDTVANNCPGNCCFYEC